MPIDPAIITRANTTLNNGTYAQKLALLKEVPFCPPSNYAGGAHAHAVTAKSPFGAGEVRAANERYLTKKKLTALTDCVAFVKFKDRGDLTGEPKSVSFEIKYAEDLTTDAARIGYTPIWFLPWESGYMWKLKIASVTATPTIALGPGTTAVPNPDLFFTAAINGCSVFVNAPPDAPRVYHGGAEQNEIQSIITQLGNAFWANVGGNAEGMWRNLYYGFNVNGGQLQPKMGPHAPLAEINKNDYVKETALGGTVLSPLSMGLPNPADRDKPSTIEAVRLEQFILNDPQFQNIRVEEVSPWGCVFGLRSGNNWEFYVQTNATIKYYSIHRQKRTFKKTKTYYRGVDDTRYDQLGQPMQWGKGHSVNFGTKQFFPQGAYAHARVDPRSFRFF